jgi:HEAT repeat protein
VSSGRIRPGWVVLAAGAILLSALVAVRIRSRPGPGAPQGPKGSKPESSGGGQKDPAAPVRTEAQRAKDQALLLDSLRAPVPESSQEIPRQEKDLRLEAAQHPDQYPALLRQILQDPAIDARWKRAALNSTEVAASLKTLDVVLEYLRAPASDPLKPFVLQSLGNLCQQLRQHEHTTIPPECVTTLEKFLAHESPAVRSAGHAALWRVQVSGFSDEQRASFVKRVLEDPDASVFGTFYAALLGSSGLQGATVAEELSRQFSRFSDPQKRVAIIFALGGAAAEGQGHLLLSGALTDGDPQVRRAAIGAIGRLKDVSMLPTLNVMLDDQAQTDPATTQSLLKCLVALETREAAQAIGKFALGKGSADLRAEALSLLQSTPGVKGDEELAGLLIAALDRPEESARKSSLLYAIGCTATAKAAETLQKEFKKAGDPELRESIAHAALGIEQPAAFALLAEALPQVATPSLKQGLLSFLSEHRRPELLPALRAEYDAPSSNASYRVDLIDAAVLLGTPAAAAFVRDMNGREKDEKVRKRLQEAMDEFKN